MFEQLLFSLFQEVSQDVSDSTDRNTEYTCAQTHMYAHRQAVIYTNVHSQQNTNMHDLI